MELGHSRILSLQHRASFDEALRTNYVFLSTCCYTAGCVEMGGLCLSAAEEGKGGR